MDSRNIVNKYKNWEQDLIVEDVKKNSLPYSVLMINLNYDFNFSTFLRNANFFGAKEVFYYCDKKKYDNRGAVGVQHVTKPNHVKFWDDLVWLSKNYSMVGVETPDLCDSVPLQGFVWPKNPLITFGSEGLGLSKEVLDLCLYKVYIPGLGSVRSLNVGCASAIVMNDFVSKYGK